MPKPITGEVLAAISSECVRLKASLFGKGPTMAKTYLNDNFLFCVMKGGLTRVEETLVGGGDQALVRQVRLRFQEQVSASFRGAVERIAERRVVAYESQVVFNPDWVVEIFVLDEGNEPPDPEAR
jgi:uncharacterized protein YbcI